MFATRANTSGSLGTIVTRLSPRTLVSNFLGKGLQGEALRLFQGDQHGQWPGSHACFCMGNAKARLRRGPPRGGSGPDKSCRFFSGPRAVPRRSRRCPSTPPEIGHSPRATFGRWECEGAASKAVRVLILGGTPVGAFAPPSTSHVI